MKKLLLLLGILFSFVLQSQSYSEPDIGVKENKKSTTFSEIILAENHIQCLIAVLQPSFCMRAENLMLEVSQIATKLDFCNRSQRRAFYRALKARWITEKHYQVLCKVWQQNKIS